MDDPRVLIVEPHEILRVMLFTILRQQPLAVDTTATPQSALQKTRTCDYALILVDLDFPNDGALEFLQAFRAERPDATSFVIGVRGNDDGRTLDPALVGAIVTKPLEIDTLASVIRECAAIVPQPAEPLPCTPAESEVRLRLERGGGAFTN